MRKRGLGWEGWLLAAALIFAALYPGRAVPAQSGGGIPLPILMYHSVTTHPSRVNDYTVLIQQLDDDLTYLKAQGYETVVISDLLAYTKGQSPLPAKPVMITFDDGHLNNLTYGLDILKKHGMRAVVSVVGAYVEEAVRQNDPNPNYAYVTWEDIQAMNASGVFEIQSHSFDLHHQDGRRGILRKEGEALSHYQQTVVQDLIHLNSLMEEKVGIRPTAFAYPYGYVSEDALPLLKYMGFQAALTCQEKMNWLIPSSECLYHLGRYNRSGKLTTWAFMQRALAQGGS